MELEPTNRYPSPRALADDIDRWLAGESVSAWQEPLADRARRWIARRRTLVLGIRIVSLIGLSAVGALVVLLTWSNRRLADTNLHNQALIRQLQTANRQTEDARHRADARVELALKAIDHFHTAVFNHLDVRYRPDLAPLRKALLQAPLEFYRTLRETGDRDRIPRRSRVANRAGPGVHPLTC
jgi:serine/threonine-protein kinase